VNALGELGVAKVDVGERVVYSEKPWRTRRLEVPLERSL